MIKVKELVGSYILVAELTEEEITDIFKSLYDLGFVNGTSSVLSCYVNETVWLYLSNRVEIDSMPREVQPPTDKKEKLLGYCDVVEKDYE